MIEHVIVGCDNVMHCDHMSLRHPQGPVLEWPQNFHDVLDNGPFIMCCNRVAGIHRILDSGATRR